MALNANKIQGKASQYDNMEPGNYPGRLVMVVDMGLQPGRVYKDQPKAPVREIAHTYEFSDEFMKDEDGQPILDKPRFLTEQMPFHNINQEKAKSTARYKVHDPANKFEGDWTKLLGNPVFITVVNSPSKDGKVYDNIGGISAMRSKDAEKLPALQNEPVAFDLDNPDLDAWKRLPEFIQKKIRGNLEYANSPLEKLLGKDATPPKTDTKSSSKPALKPAPKVEEPEDDVPY